MSNSMNEKKIDDKLVEKVDNRLTDLTGRKNLVPKSIKTNKKINHLYLKV